MRPKVAIIDPDAAKQRRLSSVLAALDVEIVNFDSAETYLLQAQRRGDSYACLIADVTLPGMSGMSLLQRIRAIDRDLPVVLLANEAEVSMAVEAMRHGATDFIEKLQLDVALPRRVSQLLRDATAHSAH